MRVVDYKVFFFLAVLLLVGCTQQDLPPEPSSFTQRSVVGDAVGLFQGYAPWYNVFNNNVTTFHLAPGRVNILEDKNVTLEVEYVQNGGFIYKTGYFFVNGGWEAFTFNGTTVGNSNWIAQNAVANLTYHASNLSLDENFLIGYACKKEQGQWKCGCSTPNGPCNQWMLQGFYGEIDPVAVAEDAPSDTQSNTQDTTSSLTTIVLRFNGQTLPSLSQDSALTQTMSGLDFEIAFLDITSTEILINVNGQNITLPNSSYTTTELLAGLDYEISVMRINATPIQQSDYSGTVSTTQTSTGSISGTNCTLPDQGLSSACVGFLSWTSQDAQNVKVFSENGAFIGTGSTSPAFGDASTGERITLAGQTFNLYAGCQNNNDISSCSTLLDSITLHANCLPGTQQSGNVCVPITCQGREYQGCTLETVGAGETSQGTCDDGAGYTGTCYAQCKANGEWNTQDSSTYQLCATAPEPQTSAQTQTTSKTEITGKVGCTGSCSMSQLGYWASREGRCTVPAGVEARNRLVTTSTWSAWATADIICEDSMGNPYEWEARYK